MILGFIWTIFIWVMFVVAAYNKDTNSLIWFGVLVVVDKLNEMEPSKLQIYMGDQNDDKTEI